ncbi:MAG: hypothetical protein AB7T38_01840 [Nitrospirales bacterium]
MDVLILFFIAFDPWRILLPAGLTMILLVSPWFSREDTQSPYSLLERVLGRLTSQLAMWLFVLTGLLGLIFPVWLAPSSYAGALPGLGPLEWLETLFYLVGVYCLWNVKCAVAKGENPRKQWTWGACVLFLLVALLWILRWDDFAFGGVEVVGSTVFVWDWTRIFSKTIHLLLSAMAAGGLVVMVIGFLPWKQSPTIREPYQSDEANEEQRRIQIVRFGMAWVLGGVVPQVVVGSWLLVSLGEDVRSHFLNGVTLGSWLFFSSLIVALLGLVFINAAFIAPYVKGLVWGGWVNILVAVFLMGFIRYEALGAGLASLNAGNPLAPLSFWHLIFGVIPMLGLLALLVRGLKTALISQKEQPTA